MEAWVLPKGVAAQHKVTLGIIFDAGGNIYRSAVFRSTDPELAKSALAALRSAQWKVQPPSCLAYQTVVATFSNPVAE